MKETKDKAFSVTEGALTFLAFICFLNLFVMFIWNTNLQMRIVALETAAQDRGWVLVK
jgi:hypothetical protein